MKAYEIEYKDVGKGWKSTLIFCKNKKEAIKRIAMIRDVTGGRLLDSKAFWNKYKIRFPKTTYKKYIAILAMHSKRKYRILVWERIGEVL